MKVKRFPLMELCPVRWHNSFKPLIGGDAFLSSVIMGVEQAKHRILFEMYLVEPGRSFDLVWQKLCAAANRGVSVYILLDDFGSRSVLSRCTDISQAHPSMYLAVYNPVSMQLLSSNFNRDHRKLIVIDDKTAWLGGFGITDDFYDGLIARKDYREPVWLDVGVRVRGEVVRDWVKLFFGTWHGARSRMVDAVSTSHAVRSEEREVSSFSLFGDDSSLLHPDQLSSREDYVCAGRVAYGAQWRRQDIVRELLTQVKSARKRIWLTTPYFVTTRNFRRQLRKASRSGVDVRVIVPGPFMDHPAIRYAGKQHYAGLIASGVKIYEYQTCFLHAKFYLCDEWISIGSFNLDHWTYRWNLEANQEIVCASFSHKMLGFYRELIDGSELVTPQQIAGMSLKEKVLVFILGKLEEFVLRFFR